MRLVVFAPGLRRSAIGRVALLIEQELGSLGHQVTLIRSETEPLLGGETHPYACDVYAWNDGARVEHAIRDADAIIYHIGDNYDFHRGALEWLPAAPGIVCLHDFFLGHLFWAWASDRRDLATKVLERWYGPHVAGTYFGHANNREFIAGTHRNAPLTEWICEMATGAIIHSNWGCDRVLRGCAGPVRAVPLAYVAPPAGSARENADDGTLRLLTIGNVNPNKRVASVITAIAANPALRARIDYRIAGHVSEETAAHLTQFGEQTGVRLALLGEVPENTLADEMAAADAVMCLRWPSLEGASASAIEAMMARKPVIVTDTGFYAELPELCVLKVDPQDEICGIQSALSTLLEDPAAGLAMGHRAAAWANTIFSPANYARHTLAMVEACAPSRAVLAGVNYFCGVVSEWSRRGSMLPSLGHVTDSLRLFEKEPPPRARVSEPDRPLVFLHIEKTAGTEFINYILEHFTPDMVADPYYGGQMSKYFDQSRKLFYYGHYGYDQVKAAGFECYLLTFLRSPIDRVFSHYKSWHNPDNLTEVWQNTMAPDEIALLRNVQEMTFDEFVRYEHPQIEAILCNLMSHRLARNPWDCPPDLDTALEVLESEITFFGITEQFELSMQLLHNHFDGCRPYIKQNYNRSPEYSSSLGATAKSRLLSFNEKDQRLYDFALDLFQKRCRDELNIIWSQRVSAV